MNDNDRSILSITMLGHGMVHMYELAIPIFITVWIAELGATSATLGIAVAIGYALYGIGSVPGGVGTDAYGSKRLLVVCLLGMGLSFGLLAFADGLLGVTLALAVWGLAASLYHPAGLRLISTGVTERGTAFGYHGIAGNVGIALGPLVAATLLVVANWRVVAALMALPALAGAIYTTYVSVEELAAVDDASPATTDGGSEPTDGGEATDALSAAEGPSLRSVLTDTRMIFAGGFLVAFPMLILEGLFYRGVLTFLPNVLASYESLTPITVAGERVDPSGYVFTGLLVVGMAGQYVGGRLSDAMPPEKAAVGAFALLSLISVLFVPAASSGLIALLLVSGLLGFVLFGEQPLLQAIVADYSDSDVRGLSYGYMFLGVFGVGAVGAAVSGAVLAYTTQQVLFLVLAVVPFVAALIAAALWRSRGIE
ncbi:MAG: MFS transporter [Natronomonas sp.]